MDPDTEASQSATTPSVEVETDVEEMMTNDDKVDNETTDETGQDAKLEDTMEELKKAPQFNCKERIVFFVDVSSAMKSESLNQGRTSRPLSFLQVLKKTLKIFLETKRVLNMKHEYAIVLINDHTTFWLQEFSNDLQQITEIIEGLEASDELENSKETFNFDDVISLLHDHCGVPEVDDLALPPPFVLRVIFIFGRSNCEILFSEEKSIEFQKMKASPYFFLDIIYIHEAPSQDNNVEATYDFFCSLDKEEKGYILDVSNGVKVLFETVAKLICHPLQRAPQNEACYSIMSVPPEQNVPEVS